MLVLKEASPCLIRDTYICLNAVIKESHSQAYMEGTKVDFDSSFLISSQGSVFCSVFSKSSGRYSVYMLITDILVRREYSASPFL